MDNDLNIIQVSTHDIGGGAEKVAFDLFNSYRRLGYYSKLIVGYKHTNDPDVIQIPNNENRNFLARYWLSNNNFLKPLYGKIPGTHTVSMVLGGIAEPQRYIKRFLGHEDYDFPGTEKIVDISDKKPDVVHCHNLHGNYFDLRAIPIFSHKIPFVITLHDAWMLSGHCAHSFDCKRWMDGCGKCPDLTISPAIKRDGTNYNWKRKREIYANSRLYIVTPSKWLMDKVKKSILEPGIVESNIIPNGVNTNIFYPIDKYKAKKDLGLPDNKKILLFAANSIRTNIWKDFKTLRDSVSYVAKSNSNILFLALGEDAPNEKIGSAEIRFIPYQKDPAIVSKYYQAADMYIHASKADTFPNSILESMASGTPVVATAVGGIPEQVVDGKTGYLTPAGDANEMASAINELLNNDERRIEMGITSADIARDNFNLDLQLKRYIDWYRHIVKTYNH